MGSEAPPAGPRYALRDTRRECRKGRGRVIRMPENALVAAVREALSEVVDPEIKRPITELGMVESISVDDDDVVSLTVLLTIPGCPMKSTIEHDVTAAVTAVPGCAAST